MLPNNSSWLLRRRIKQTLKDLALQLITRVSSEDRLQELEEKLCEALSCLQNQRQLSGRSAWLKDDEDHGDSRTIAHEVTALSGKSNVVAPPVTLWLDREKQRSHGKVHCNWLYEGPPDCLHGGTIASIMDEIMGATPMLLDKQTVTASLNVQYIKPTPLNTDLNLEGKIVSVSGKKIICSGKLIANGEVTASVESLLIEIEGGIGMFVKK